MTEMQVPLCFHANGPRRPQDCINKNLFYVNMYLCMSVCFRVLVSLLDEDLGDCIQAKYSAQLRYDKYGKKTTDLYTEKHEVARLLLDERDEG